MEHAFGLAIPRTLEEVCDSQPNGSFDFGYALLVCGVVHLFVVFVEGPSLHHQFGESYGSYQRTVPRWLPRFLHR